MALEQDASSRTENLYASCRKRGYHPESRIMLKTGQQEKLYPPSNVSVLLAAVSPTTTFG